MLAVDFEHLNRSIRSKMVFICTYESCQYSNNRLDLYNRHLRNVHGNAKKVCECGRKVQSGNLARHKSSGACPLKPQVVDEVNESNESNKSNDLDVSNNNSSDQRSKISFEVNLIRKKDGMILMMHENIDFCGVPLILSAVQDASNSGNIKKKMCDVCGKNVLSANLARHKRNCKIRIIEPELLLSVEAAGIEINDVVDVQKYPIEITLQINQNADGSNEIVFDPIPDLDGIKLEVAGKTIKKVLNFSCSC